MRKREFSFHACLLVALASASACTGPGNPGSTEATKILVAPGADAYRAAADFKHEFPSARIFFSQNSGELLWIDGAGTPLAQGQVDTPEHALAIIQNWMVSHPNLYRIQDPLSSLGALTTDLRTQGQAQGVISLHFEQLQAGLPVRGKSGTAIFNASGALLGLQTHLMTTASFEVDPTAAVPAGAVARSARTSMEPGSRQVWESLEGAGRYKVIEERVERDGVQLIRTLRDARTGTVLQSLDETPSDIVPAPTLWALQPYAMVSAHDTLGHALQIPSTPDAGALVLGFHLPAIHSIGRAVLIADAGPTPLTPTRNDPLATNDADWVSEASYDSALRSATTLALNIKTTLEWYNVNLGRASWDGKGATLHASVRGTVAGKTGPQLNAWGGGGILTVGSGLSPTGQPLSDALDVVAHEFTHSVIDSTTPLQYHDESGALNESLADIFGKTVQGFPDMIEGSQAGVHFRDLANPQGCISPDGSDCTQPGVYSEYRLIAATQDAGGVHTNSGITSLAFARVIQAAPATSSAASGLTPRGVALISLILDSLIQAGYDTGLSLEDFAAGLTAYCKAREQAGSLQMTQSGYCQQLESAFNDAELLARAF